MEFFPAEVFLPKETDYHTHGVHVFVPTEIFQSRWLLLGRKESHAVYDLQTGLERRRRLSWGEVSTHSASWLSTESFRHPAVGGRPALVAAGETHLAQDISLSPHVVCSDTRVSVPCTSVEIAL